jgi:hypothetical protein
MLRSGASCDNNHANGDTSLKFCTDDRFSVLSQNLCLATKKISVYQGGHLEFQNGVI